MRRLTGPALVVVSVAAALVPLLLLDGSHRALGFRIFTAVLGVAVIAVISDALSATDAPPVRSPFLPKRRNPLRAVLARVPRRGGRALNGSTAYLVQASTTSAGTLHHRLRPLLQEIVDERLRARHAATLLDPRASSVVGPTAWQIVRPDRPRPADRRGPGISHAELAEVLNEIEAL